MTNGEIFKAAAQYLREHGWRQKGYGEHGGPRCVVGALGSVYGVVTPNDLTRVALLDSHPFQDVVIVPSTRVGGLPQWNDAPERTPEEVIAMLDSLAFDEDLKAAATAHTLDTPTPETGALVSQPQLVEA